MDTGRVQSKVSASRRYLSVLQSNFLDMDTKVKEPSVCIIVEICIIEFSDLCLKFGIWDQGEKTLKGRIQ